MNEQEMLQTLEEHHRTIRTGLEGLRRHCSEPSPSSTELDAERLALREASMARSAFISDVMLPALLTGADVQLRSELSELLVFCAAKRQVSDTHITIWTQAAIEQDWAGYCGAAGSIWAMMEDQMEREWRLLSGTLRKR